MIVKRSVLILLASVLILLTGCRRKAPEIRDTFEADVTVTGGDPDCTAHLSRTPDALTLSLLSPSSVAGIRYVFADGELHTSYGELNCITRDDSLPQTAVASILFETLSRLGDAEYEGSEDGADRYRLHLQDGDAVIICRDGLPRVITVDFSPCVFTLTG